MTILFVISLACLGFLMKLVVLLVPATSRNKGWEFILSPLPSPVSLRRPRGWSGGPELALRTLLFGAGFVLHHWIYWWLVLRFNLDGMVLGYLAAPALLLMGDLFVGLLALVWLPTGRRLPGLHRHPLAADGVSDFWGRRWNLWFSDWFRLALFNPMRRRPVVAVLVVFLISGLMHEGVINLPLRVWTGENRFGGMTVYFSVQGLALLFEHQLVKHAGFGRRLFGRVVVLGPVPLLINEGMLRILHLWRG